jgi:hypothetical protein
MYCVVRSPKGRERERDEQKHLNGSILDDATWILLLFYNDFSLSALSSSALAVASRSVAAVRCKAK